MKIPLKATLLFLFIFLTMQANAQLIKGKIVDDQSQSPIAYANIGVIGKYTGTVSDQYGRFELSLDNLPDTDTLRVSMITHFSKDFLIKELRTSGESITISLKEKVIELDEVVVRSRVKRAFKTKTLGIKRKWCYPVPFNKKVTSNIQGFASYLGEEIGAYYPLEDGKHALDSVQLNIYSADADTVKFRLNVYKPSGENILKKPIYISMTQSEIVSSPVISLTEYNLTVDSDFIVALENIEGIGSLTILATFKSRAKKFKALRRKNNQSDWQVIDSQGLGSGTTGISLLAFVNKEPAD